MNKPSFPALAIVIAFGLGGTGTAGHAQTIQGVTEESPYAQVQDGKVVGPASEIVEASLRRAGLLDYRIALYPWARAYDMALKQPNVLIFPIARTPAREAQFKWAGEFTRIDHHFYKLRDNHGVVVRSLRDAKNYSIGVVRDDVRHQYLQAQGFSKMVVSARNADTFRMLLTGQVQLVPMPERDAVALCEQARVDYATLERVYTLNEISTGIYMAYSNATPDETVARTRAAFAKLKADGTVARLIQPAR